MQSLLKWEESIRREPSKERNTEISASEEAEQLEERLLRSLGRLETMAHDVQERLSRFAFEVRDDFEPLRRAAAVPLRVSEYRSEELLDQFLAFDADNWVDAVDVEAGPWGLHLAGTALPKPQLAVSVRANQVGAPSFDPFLTLVRPAEGFDTVNLDSSGNGKIALPAGESVFLLQANEVREVRLSFGDGRGRKRWTEQRF